MISPAQIGRQRVALVPTEYDPSHVGPPQIARRLKVDLRVANMASEAFCFASEKKIARGKNSLLPWIPG